MKYKQVYQLFIVRRLFSFLMFGATIIAPLITILFLDNSAYAAVTTSKTGRDTTINSSTQTAPSNTINWVLSYEHTGILGSMQLDDPIPTGTQYVPNSLVVPPGYTASYSTNGGTSYSATDGGTSTTNLRATGTSQPTTDAGKTSITSSILKPPASFHADTAAGDGFEMLFYGDKLYNINHHNTGNAYIQCHDKLGNVCSGYPTYTPVTGAFGTGTSDYITGNINFAGLDQSTGKIYMATYRISTNDRGVACIDVATKQGCGYTYMTNQLVSGGALVGKKYYFVDQRSNVYCFDVTTNAACGAPYPIATDPSITRDATIDAGAPDVALQSIANRYLFVNLHMSDDPATPGTNEEQEHSLSCIDLTTDALCGPARHYTAPDPSGGAVGNIHNIVMAPILNTSGVVTGICGLAAPGTDDSAPFACFNIDGSGGQFAAPWGQMVPNASIGSFHGQGSTYLFDLAPSTKLYFPYRHIAPDADEATYTCWDFATNAACAGFTPVHRNDAVRPYNLRPDPNTGCIWEVGDLGQFEVFDPTVGGNADCTSTNTSISSSLADPAAYYCDGQSGHFTNWDKLVVRNLTTTPSSAYIGIAGVDGQPLSGYNARQLTATELSTGIIDLSALPISGNTAKLNIRMTFIAADGTNWTEDGNAANDPYIQLSWTGDDIQFCYQTTVLPCTQTAGITNNATFTTNDPSSGTDAASAHLDWSPASQCAATPNFTVDKSANPTTGLQRGSVITYTITTTNTGNVPLTNVVTTDPRLSNLGCQPAQPATLNPGDPPATCTGTYTVTQADVDAGHILNQAQTCADSSAGANQCKQSPQLDLPVPRNPQLTPVKTMTSYDDTDGSGALSQGDTAHYQIIVTNTGNTTITDASVNDNRISSLNCQPTQPLTLAPGDKITCTGTLIVTAGDQSSGNLTNTATCTGTPPASTTLPACTRTVDQPITPSAPGIQIAKSQPTNNDSDHNNAISAGDTLAYRLTVHNSGSQQLTNVTVSDPMLTGITCSPSQPATLAIGADMICSGTHVVTQAEQDAGQIVNVASTSGQGTGGTVTDSDTQTVNTVQQQPSLTILKTANPSAGAPLGSVITYTILVTNNGNVTMTGVNVTDSLLQDLSCTPNQPSTLAPNTPMTCTGTHTVTQDDIDAGKVSNTATVKGRSPNNTEVTKQDDIDVPLTRTAHLTNTKEFVTFDDLDHSGGASTNDVLHYKLVATNDGSVTLTNVSITDTPALNNVSCQPTQPTTLQPGQALICTGTHIVTQAEQNTGKAHDEMDSVGTPPPGVNPIDPVKQLLDVPLDAPRKALGVNKAVQSATDPDLTGDISPGDVVTYQIVATNNGNVTLSQVTVDDPSLNSMTCTPSTPATLAPGFSTTCTGTYTVTSADVPPAGTGTHTNTATAHGVAPDGTDVNGSDTRSIVITPPEPHIAINKILTNVHDNDGDSYITPGDVLDYRLVAQNTGNILLNGVVVSDSRIAALTCQPTLPASLAPAGYVTCTGSYTVTQADQNIGEVVNTAHVTGRAPDQTEVTDDDTVTQATAGRAPNATIVKTIDGQTSTTRYELGDIANYTIVYTNTGNVTLHTVAVTDDRIRNLVCDKGSPVSLAPTEKITCKGSGPSFTQIDQDIGQVTNVATGIGTSGIGPLERNDSATALLADYQANIKTEKSHTLRDLNSNQLGDKGEVVSYTIVATNTGNVTSFGTVVTDNRIPNLNCDKQMPINLAPGAKITCKADYTVSEVDAKSGRIANIATTTANDPKGHPIVSVASTTRNTTFPLAKTGQTAIAAFWTWISVITIVGGLMTLWLRDISKSRV